MVINPRTRLTAAACILVAVVVIYFFVDPASTALAPRCLFKALTGFDCPGCGFQRALHAALHGDFATAWACNPALFFFIPVTGLYAFAELMPRRAGRLRRVLISPAAIIALALAFVAWWVIRNFTPSDC